MPFKLSLISRKNLEGVHPDLVLIVERAIHLTAVNFRVICGVRSITDQRKMVQAGASQTMNSRHLVQEDGWGHAVDLVALENGAVRWVPWSLYESIAATMKAAAKEFDVPIEWGGDWKTFKDGVHFQLPRGYGE